MKNGRKEYNKTQLLEKVCMVHGKELQRFIYHLTRQDQFVMEEIYQNTMLEALNGLDDLRDVMKMKSWIFSIAKAEAKRYYAAYRSQNNFGCGIAAEEASEYGTMHDFTKSMEDRESVKNLIRSLSETERQIYILHYYHDLSLKEISARLNMNYNTVRSMHMRGMKKIRKLLTKIDQIS